MWLAFYISGLTHIVPRSFAQAVGVLERLRAACGSNVGAGHLAGWLGAALSTL